MNSKGDSAIHIHVPILPQTPFPSRLPHNIEQSSLSYTVGPDWLSILKIAGFIDLPKLPNYPFPRCNVSSFSKSVSLFLFCKQVHLYPFFLDSTYKGCYTI